MNIDDKKINENNKKVIADLIEKVREESFRLIDRKENQPDPFTHVFVALTIIAEAYINEELKKQKAAQFDDILDKIMNSDKGFH